MRSISKPLILFFLLFPIFLFASGKEVINIDSASHALVAPEGAHYQWFRNNEPLQGERNRELSVSESGTYSVEVIDEVGGISRQEATVAVTATGAIIRIYIIGDSTVMNYKTSDYPQTGWGQLLPLFFNSTISITNNAIGGRSSRSFTEEGRWTTVKDALVAGDYVFIQFGHNDRDYSNVGRYTPVADYKTYLTTFCKDAKAKGAIPVLVSPMVMNAWTGTTMRNVFTESGNDYRGGMLEVATALNVAFIDLNMKSWNLYKTYGSAFNQRFLFKGLVAGEYPNYPTGITDGTHFQEMGSLSHCRMITEGIKELSSRADMANLISNLKPLYSIGISVNPTGSDDMTTKTGTYPQGATVTLKTIPKNTSTFQKWNNASGTLISTNTLTTVTSGTSATSFVAIYQGATNTCGSTISTSGTTTICQGGSVTLTASSGSSYIWKNGTSQVGTASTYKATTAGSYTVEVTDASSCKATSSATVVTVAAPTLWYADTDGDGKGDPNTSQTACAQLAGYVADKTDLCPTDVNKIAPGNCGCGKTEESCLDCNGTANGTAKLDNCDRCVAGTTGKIACVLVGEAETDACSYDGVLESSNLGFKGTSYINVPNVVGSVIAFNISAANAGTAILSFRYANGGANGRPAQISLNNSILSNNLNFPTTGTFTDWKVVEVSVTLLKGTNTLQLISTTADGLANIDQIGYVSAGLTIGSCVITSLEEEVKTSFRIAPNPFTETIQIDGVGEYTLYDLPGNQLTKGDCKSKCEIGSNLPSGIYMLEMKVGNGVKRIKITKQ
jgi:lysophospholipase L1-like esterase